MVDHFRVMRRIARGGQGEVYVARDTKLGRKVALKLISGKKEISRERTERLLREAQATARFQHPNIVTVHSVGEHEGLPYVAFEYLEGETLRQRMRSTPISAAEAFRLMLPVALAVAEAHRHGVLHRDLKPENVLIPIDGRVRVLDFGLASLIDDGEATDLTSTSGGTPPYMAPELWRGRAPAEASDVWALGVLAYELLAGRRPFEAETRTDLGARITTVDPEPIEVPIPTHLSAIIFRALDRSPELRPTARALAAAIEGALAGGAPEMSDESPYPGLASFSKAQRPFFFGRTREVLAFLEKLRGTPILPVVGPTGAGKSSFLRAGVIPRIEEQRRWVVIEARPGKAPFLALARRLAPSRSEIPALADRLAGAPETLSLELFALAERENAHVLLYVDQLEEICTLVDDRATRERFVRAVLTAADDPQDPVRAVFTLRDDFLGRIPGGAIVDQVLGHAFVLRPPDDEALREVIVGPLSTLGYGLDDPALADDMIESVRRSSVTLPLLQFTCRALWEKRNREAKTIERSTYAALGGVAGALASHADRVLDGMTDAQASIARALLLRFVTEDGTRQVLDEASTMDGLPQGAGAIRDRFVEARLLTVLRTDDGPTYELAHDALVREWKRLARWIEEDRDPFLEEIERAASAWAKRGRAKDEVWRGDALAEAHRRIARASRSTTSLVAEFISAGQRIERRRLLERRVTYGSALTLVALVALVFFTGQQEAERERRRADVERAHAEREAAELAHARGDVWGARARLRTSIEIADDLRTRASWLRLEADPILLRDGPVAMRVAWSRAGPLLLRWKETMLELDPVTFEGRRTLGRPGEHYVLALGPKGEVAVGSGDGSVSIADTRTTAHEGPVSALVFSEDGGFIASGGWDGKVRVHSVPDLAPVATVPAHADRVYGLVFGATILSSGWDGTLAEWSPATRSSRTLASVGQKVFDLAAKDGLVALGREDGVVDLVAGGERTSIPVHRLGVTGVAFHPKEPWLVTASWDGTLRSIDVATRKLLGPPIPLGDAVHDLAFEPGSGRAIVALRTKGVAIVDLERIPEADDPGPPPIADVVAIASDGTIAVPASENRIVLRDPETGLATRIIEGHTNTVRGVAFRPGSSDLAAGGFDETVRVFDSRNGRMRQILTGHGAPVSMVAYSPDGRFLASVGFDAQLRIHDAETGAPVAARPLPERSITVRFSPDGTRVVAGSFGGHIDLFAVPGWTKIAALRCTNARIAHEIVFVGDDQLRAICGPTLETFSTRDGTSTSVDLGAEYACLDRSADGARTLHAAGEGIALEDRSGATIAVIPRPTHACAFSPEGAWFATIEPDGAVRRYEARSGEPLWLGPKAAGASIAIGDAIGSGRADGVFELRDRAGVVLTSMRLFGPIGALDLAPPGRLTVKTELGDARVIDVSPLGLERCAFLRSVWAKAPSIWASGRAVPSPPPRGHACR
jgi:WD40 repeat protein